MEEIDLLDISWIESFEKNEKYYNMFYLENNKSIKTNILYINKGKELEKIREIKIHLSEDNIIKKNDFIKIIKEFEKIDNKKYTLMSILIYNLTIENKEIKNFLYNSDKYDFMKELKYLNTYELSSTVNCFQDVNNLYIILMEKEKKNGNNTKKIRCNEFQLKKTRRRKAK